MGEPQIDVLDRAKAKQLNSARTTDVWMKLDLLEDMIAEIVALRHRVEALSASHVAPIRERAEKRAEQ